MYVSYFKIYFSHNLSESVSTNSPIIVLDCLLCIYLSSEHKNMVVHMQKCVLARQKMHKNDDKHFACDPSPIAERFYPSSFLNVFYFFMPQHKNFQWYSTDSTSTSWKGTTVAFSTWCAIYSSSFVTMKGRRPWTNYTTANPFSFWNCT